MTREEAMRKMQAVKSYMTSGNPIWDVAEMAEAFDMAIEALFEKKKMKWIPASEKLPSERQSVILSTKEWTGEGCYWETTKHHVIWKGYKWNATYWDDEVIAWMPLPMPYRGGGTE